MTALQYSLLTSFYYIIPTALKHIAIGLHQYITKTSSVNSYIYLYHI